MVDASKLSRDYKTNPIKMINKRFEKIPYEDLYEMFINQDMSKPEIMEYTGITWRPLKTQLKNYGIAKSNDDKAKNLKKEDIIEYYINQNHRMEDTCKHFNISQTVFSKYCRRFGISKPKSLMYENYKQTNQKLHGVDNQFQRQEIIEKSQETMFNKYGVKHYAKHEDFLVKNKETRLEKYGKDDPYQREKAKETILDKYGVSNIDYINFTPEQIKLVTDKEYLEQYIKENNIKNASELSTKAKLSPATTNKIINEYNLRHLFDYTGSQYERRLQELVKQVGFEYKANYKIPTSKKEIDIYIPELNLGIEFNGDYWHSDMTRPDDYHLQKSILAENNGIFIYHIFEHQWLKHSDIIIKELAEMLGIKQVFDKEYEIREINNIEAQKFITENSLYNFDKDTNLNYGLFVDGVLIHIQSYLVDSDTIITHDCNLLNYDYKNASNILFDYYCLKHTLNNVIVLTNIGYKNENYPINLGLKLTSILNPTYKWLKSGKIEEAVKGEDEQERIKNKWFKIYDCGMKLFNLYS